MKRVYYNENDPKAAAWLKELIRCGHVADGDVDERSIVEVQPADLAGYRQVHLFAGIGGWSVALRLAGIRDDEEAWTGSCPCPPFSSAGKKKACVKCGGRPFPCPWITGYFTCSVCDHSWLADARHLWPEMWRLVAQRRPSRVFGEQVASDDGRIWLAGIRSTMEQVGYDFGASDLCAAGVGSPQIRQRLYWVGYAEGERHDRRDGRKELSRRGTRRGPEGSGDAGRVADAGRGGDESLRQHGNPSGAGGEAEGEAQERQRGGHDARHGSKAIGLADAKGRALGVDGRASGKPGHADERKSPGILADADGDGRSKGRKRVASPGSDGAVGNGGAGALDQSGRIGGAPGLSAPSEGREESADLPDDAGDASLAGGLVDSLFPGREGHPGVDQDGTAAAAGAGCYGFWSDFELLPCTDGKARRIEPGTFPLAHGVPGRVGLLRGYGNAIVPQQAALFVEAAETRRRS